MKTISFDGVTLSIFFDTRRQKENLAFPVKYRVTFKRKRAYFSSGVDLAIDQWKSMPTTTDLELIKKRELIFSGYEKVLEHVRKIMKDKEFSLELLNEQLKKKSPGSIRAAFSRKIRLLGKTGQAATASTYECTINSIRRFTDTDLGFSDITPEWLKNYEKHLLAEGKSIITVKFYMGCIRSIMNVAKAENKVTEAQYPFGRGKFEIKKGTGRRPALTISQISEIMKFPSLSEPEMRSRDLWLFSYFTNGINFSDMLMLRYKDIAFGEIHFFRKRTSGTASNKKEITASLLPEMREIINKWGNIDRKPDSYIFPYLNEKMDQATARKTIQNVIRLTNKRLHEISKRLNIGAVSTSSARHSYAAVLKRSGVNIAFISEALGHSDLRTTESYIASLEQEERAKNALKLTTFKSWYD